MDVFQGGSPSTHSAHAHGDSAQHDVVPLRAPLPRRLGESALTSLAALSLAGRFCAWRGASDQRCVASVYPVDRGAVDAGLPGFEAFVLISVARGPIGRRILDVAAIERSSDLRASVSLALNRGADEWHVHFLAEDRSGRASLVADLRARHCNDTSEARCA